MVSRGPCPNGSYEAPPNCILNSASSVHRQPASRSSAARTTRRMAPTFERCSPVNALLLRVLQTKPPQCCVRAGLHSARFGVGHESKYDSVMLAGTIPLPSPAGLLTPTRADRACRRREHLTTSGIPRPPQRCCSPHVPTEPQRIPLDPGWPYGQSPLPSMRPSGPRPSPAGLRPVTSRYGQLETLTRKRMHPPAGPANLQFERLPGDRSSGRRGLWPRPPKPPDQSSALHLPFSVPAPFLSRSPRTVCPAALRLCVLAPDAAGRHGWLHVALLRSFAK
ncbi:hypothetical protein H180DRAFT_04303 [Streptomyces sp. WMMB 322]|nr:hypothetical protein H180DRAFT_04303 [Streptomyces sp. WMMB 322]